MPAQFPALDMVSLGSNVHVKREGMQLKHSAVMDSMHPLDTEESKDLDPPYSKDGLHLLSLCEIILDARHCTC